MCVFFLLLLLFFSPGKKAPHKWDRRTYILIASYTPLVVYYNAGYIQRSPFSIASKHKLSTVSNPHVVDGSIEDYTKFLRPKSAMDETFVAKFGSGRAAAIAACVDRATANALLQVVFALQGKFRLMGTLPNATFVHLGIDVVTDEMLRPFVVDVNPAPGLRRWYPWSVQQMHRQLTLEMLDLAYEVESRKQSGIALDSQELMAATRAWTLVANEADPNFAAKHGYLAEGQCMESVQNECVPSL